MRRLACAILLCASLPSAAQAAPDPAYRKPAVAVARFDNSTGKPVDVGIGLADKMARALADSGKVVVVERLRLEEVMDEQKLSLAGLIDPQTACEVGRLIGADYVVVGNLDQFDYQETAIPLGRILEEATGVHGASHIGHRSFTIAVGVTATIIDTETAATDRGAGYAERRGGGLGFDIYDRRGIGWGQLNRGIVGEAIHEAIDRAVHDMLRQVFIPRVLKRAGDEVYIDEGVKERVRPGDHYRVLREEILPGGHVITETVGEIRVTRVWETASRAVILYGGDRIESGQLVRFLPPPRSRR